MSGVSGGAGQNSGDHLTPHRSPRLVVAHGDGSYRAGLAGILRRAGYDVGVAADVDAVLAMRNTGKLDALVVDFRLPPSGCRGLLEVCHGPLPTIVIGGAADDIEVLADRRVQAVLVRPFALQDLYDAVAKATS